ncbi:TraB/GumN family protein [Brevundimonas sp.]|uniref:TraB/GumN family protein n=1 Tax=Brevundimonas sp. TaxID=1871086 RepID=UPI002FDA4FE5
MMFGSVGARAQTPDADPSLSTDAVEDVIVAARRSGAPMWEITRGDATLILVGDLNGTPDDLDWRPDALEAATARVQRVMTPPAGRVSGSDFLRLIWRIRTIGTLPQGVDHADYLGADWNARLEAVMADERNETWRRRSPVMLSFDLLKDRAGYRRGDRLAGDAVRRAARKARIPVRSVGFVRGDEIIESLIAQPPEAYAPCIRASIEAAEAGPDGFRARAEAWRRWRVAEVVASPLDRALFQCWPYGDPSIGPQLNGLWVEAIDGALNETGVTLAVAPLRLLAESGGVLDRLDAAGFEIVGPAWKAVP